LTFSIKPEKVKNFHEIARKFEDWPRDIRKVVLDKRYTLANVPLTRWFGKVAVCWASQE
jgi:hypothetical protein